MFGIGLSLPLLAVVALNACNAHLGLPCGLPARAVSNFVQTAPVNERILCGDVAPNTRRGQPKEYHMPKIVLAMAAADDRSGLLLLAIWAVLVLAGGMGAVMLSAIPSPYGDILFIAAAFVALILTFPVAAWIEDKIATRRSGVA